MQRIQIENSVYTNPAQCNFITLILMSSITRTTSNDDRMGGATILAYRNEVSKLQLEFLQIFQEHAIKLHNIKNRNIIISKVASTRYLYHNILNTDMELNCRKSLCKESHGVYHLADLLCLQFSSSHPPHRSASRNLEAPEESSGDHCPALLPTANTHSFVELILQQ